MYTQGVSGESCQNELPDFEHCSAILNSPCPQSERFVKQTIAEIIKDVKGAPSVVNCLHLSQENLAPSLSDPPRKVALCRGAGVHPRAAK